jgi:hypothetical protein
MFKVSLVSLQISKQATTNRAFMCSVEERLSIAVQVNALRGNNVALALCSILYPRRFRVRFSPLV